MKHGLFAFWIFVTGVLALGSAEARTLSGSATYPARIALAPGAELVVAVETPDGAPVAETRRELGDEQVPLSFSLEAPDDRDLVLRVALFHGGRVEWLSEAALVEAGSDDVALAPLPMSRFAATGFSTRMRCGEEIVELGFIGQGARLKAGGRVIDLAPEPAASGARFVAPDDPGAWAWSRGNRALVSLDGRQLPECRPVIAPPLFPLSARGQEPGWTLSIEKGWFRYLGDYGATEIEGTLSHPETTPEGLRFELTPNLAATISDEICRDAATGMPYPASVALVHGGASLAGCAGEPEALLNGEWRVTSVDAAVVEGQGGPWIGFSTGGRIWGSGGCNRITGGYALTGEGLSLDRVASTMMACPPEVMAAERRFLDALAGVDRFDIGPDGALRLIGADRVAIEAQR